jgi:UDP-N-acetylmuramate dehydrogenase
MATSLPSEASSAVAVEPRAFVSNALSTFRTKHSFDHYGSFSSPEEFIAYRAWARERRLPFYVVGKGSNLLFCRRRVRALVLLNKLPRQLSRLSENRFYVSSSTGIGEVLRVCREFSLDSFYYLASVPASVGGALVMNAGRGPKFNQTIYDFVESVTVLVDQTPVTLARSEVALKYRWTPFLDRPETLVLGATFHFPPTELENDPVAERMRYCKDVQDPVAPNCGSAFSHYDLQTMERLRGLTMFGASFSDKTTNWILNRSESSLGIRSLLLIARALHAIRRRAYRVEYVCIK